MKIEVIHWRDPDSESLVAVFVDGKEVTPAHEVHLDPGKGWVQEDWDQLTEGFEVLSPAARELAEEWFRQASDSTYIQS